MAAGGAARRRPDMQRHHGALAEADQRQRRRRQLAARQFGVEECIERGRRLVDADPALVGIAERQREPLPADRRLAAGLGRMRRHERGVRQHRLPGAADVDQVVAVGAIAVQEHHEALGLAAAAVRAAGRRVQRPFVSLRLLFRWFVCLTGLMSAGVRPARPRAASPRDSRPTADAPPPPRHGRHASASLIMLCSRRARFFRSKRDARRLLQGEVAGRPGVGMAEAEQQIDVGGPRPDAVQRDQRGMRLVGLHLRDGVEIDVALRRSPCRSP